MEVESGSWPAFIARFRSEAAQMAWIQGARRGKGPAGGLDSTSKSPTERNAVDTPESAAAAEGW